MTLRQSVLKAFYPLLIRAGKLFGLQTGIRKNSSNHPPLLSFYSLKITAIDKTEIDVKTFKGKHVLIVNTASDCGYTGQLGELEKLYQLYKKELVVVAFPSNDFKQQEKLSDNEISSFCDRNYGLSFLLAEKSVVKKGPEQNEVFQWLSDKEKNGWNDQAPEWNFSKYLINKKGILTNYYGAGIEPLSRYIIANIN